MTTGDRIYELRKQLGLTLEDVGNAVGVGKSTVRKWEKGMIKNMRRDKIHALAVVLKTTPAHLMGWDEESSLDKEGIKKKLTDIGELPDHIQAFIDLLEGVSEEEAGQLLQLIKLFLGREK